MTEVRRHFHDELADLENELLEMGQIADEQIEKAVRAVVTKDQALAGEVVEGDEELDRRYLDLQHRWHEIMALQTPVAIDLRLMSLILHTNHSIERIGDQAVNMANLVHVTEGLPTRQGILDHLQEMGDLVRPMLHVVLEALTKRDLHMALRLPEMDDPVDRLNDAMWREVVECADDKQTLEWAIRMLLASRALERIGDRAVDIAEDVAFLLTGIHREFPDGWDGPLPDDA